VSPSAQKNNALPNPSATMEPRLLQKSTESAVQSIAVRVLARERSANILRPSARRVISPSLLVLARTPESHAAPSTSVSSLAAAAKWKSSAP
jgi:hypothetical protein